MINRLLKKVETVRWDFVRGKVKVDSKRIADWIQKGNMMQSCGVSTLMRIPLLSVLLGITVFACQSAPVGEPESVEPEPNEAMLANTVTKQEEADSWQLLFDGHDLSSWRGFKMEDIPPGWTIDVDSLHFDGRRGGEGAGDLTTKEQFSDFELKLEWRISPGANSGVLYRVTEDYDEEYMSGPEFQIIDDKGYSSKLEDTQLSGANYGLHSPSKDVVMPPGEWNQMRLLVSGPHVEHWLNGEMVVAYQLWTNQWKEMVANSKFAVWAGYGMSPTGYIVLQDHGASVWFRNIRIKALPSAEDS